MRVPWWTPVLLLAGLLIAAVFLAGAEREVQEEAGPAPDLRIEDIASVQYPDPVHLRLADGRVFRLAGVVGPDPGTPEYAAALEMVPGVLGDAHNRKRGLRFLGGGTAGEFLAEPWGLLPEMPRCGTLSPGERPHSDVPHWKNLTVELIGSGLYWLEPGVTDPELIHVQRAVRKGGIGIWGNPVYLRRLLDVAGLEALLQRAEARDQRLESAELLLRADPGAYAPRLLALVKDPQERDVYTRIGVAQLLDKARFKEGTDYLMEAVRSGGKGMGLEGAVSSIMSEYSAFRMQRAMAEEERKRMNPSQH